jgi:hypothetical protein
MENKATDYEEYFDPTTDRWLEPISNTTSFNYDILEWGIQLLLEDSISEPYFKDVDNYNEFTVMYSECNYESERLQSNDQGNNYNERLYAAIRYNREKSRRNYL